MPGPWKRDFINPKSDSRVTTKDTKDTKELRNQAISKTEILLARPQGLAKA
jgi:hypothetical protein